MNDMPFRKQFNLAVTLLIILMGQAIFVAAMLVTARKMVADYDVDVPRLFETISTLGIPLIASAWIAYGLLAIVSARYFKIETQRRVWVSAFFFVSTYYLIVVLASAYPWMISDISVM